MLPLERTQPRRSRAQWKSLIDRHAQSGLSGKEFCQREALSYASFAKWRSKLKPNSGAKVEEFIELRAERLPLTMPAHEAALRECLLELQVGSSVTVRIYEQR